jgi:hypothetical protein
MLLVVEQLRGQLQLRRQEFAVGRRPLDDFAQFSRVSTLGPITSN